MHVLVSRAEMAPNTSCNIEILAHGLANTSQPLLVQEQFCKDCIIGMVLLITQDIDLFIIVLLVIYTYV